MPVSIRHIRIRPVSFALRMPFVTAAGQKTETHNVQIIVELSNGLRGYGEASSSIAMPQMSQSAMDTFLRGVTPALSGELISDTPRLMAQLWSASPDFPTAIAGLECALLDAWTRGQRRSLANWFGGKTQSIETDLTLSVAEPDILAQRAKQATRAGFKKLKVKLAGNSWRRDSDRLAAVHRAAPHALLVADGNQGFTLTRALDLLAELHKQQLPIAFFEQPFPKNDYKAMRAFRKKSKLPLIADESVLSPADALHLFETGAADGVNIKVAKSGVFGALEIIRIARRFRKFLSIGCMEESKLGLAASVHLACGTGVFDWIDLDSVFLMRPSRINGGFAIRGPQLSVKSIREGIGIA